MAQATPVPENKQYISRNDQPDPAGSDGEIGLVSEAGYLADPELFFPIGTAGPALLQLERAKQVCAGCQVRISCLDWALATGQDAGVWGGTGEDERRALRRLRRASANDSVR